MMKSQICKQYVLTVVGHSISSVLKRHKHPPSQYLPVMTWIKEDIKIIKHIERVQPVSNKQHFYLDIQLYI